MSLFPRSAYEAATLREKQAAVSERLQATLRKRDDSSGDLIKRHNAEADCRWLAAGNRTITRYRF